VGVHYNDDVDTCVTHKDVDHHHDGNSYDDYTNNVDADNPTPTIPRNSPYSSGVSTPMEFASPSQARMESSGNTSIKPSRKSTSTQ
jgi:hypothetical protein